jgi:hypothetical protein
MKGILNNERLATKRNWTGKLTKSMGMSMALQVFNTLHPSPYATGRQNQPGPESREGVLPSAGVIK